MKAHPPKSMIAGFKQRCNALMVRKDYASPLGVQLWKLQ